MANDVPDRNSTIFGGSNFLTLQRFSWRAALACALATAVAGVLLAACGSDGDSSAVERGSTAPTGVEVPAASDYDRDATLRYSSSWGVTTFDAHKSGAGFDNTTLFLVYDRLVHSSPDASPGPGLATSWEFSDNGTALTFKLRDHVKFQDGTEFNAEAVKANIERAQTVEGSAVASDLALIESVEVVDPLTVTFHLSGPGAHLPLLLSDRPGVMISPAAFDNPDLDEHPVGTGMFTVTTFQRDALIVFERNEDYWDPDAVRIRRLELTVTIDSTTRLNALRTGTIDVTGIDARQVAEAEAAGLTIVSGSTLQYYHLQPNRSFEPFADVGVRRAINHAINRQGIIDALFAGGAAVAGQVFPEGYLAFDPDTGSEPYPYDPERARELLAETEYADGFEFDLIVPSNPILQQLAEVIQAQLGDVGITVNLDVIDSAQVIDVFYVQQRGDALVSAWAGRADPSVTLQLMFSDTGFSNPGRHTTPEVQAAIEATLASQTDEERTAALQAASAAVTDAALSVPLCFPSNPHAMTENVLNWQVWTSGRPELRNVGVAAQ